MTNRLFVHIGRHKTGTSSLQRFLKENPSGLTANGFYYPGTAIRGYGHHDFASQFTRSNIKHNPVAAPEQVRIREQLQQEIKDNLVHRNVIISSEAFQNCSPQVITDLFKSYKASYVVYLREQAGYLISSYAQAVQATNLPLTLEEFEAKKFHAHYDRFLESWEKVAGRDNLMIRVFDRDNLFEGDIIRDFLLHVLGIPKDKWGVFQFHNADQNPSLGTELIEFKRLLNLAGVPPSKDLYQAFRQLALQQDESTKPVLTRKLLKKITAKYSQGNQKAGLHFFQESTALEIRGPVRQPSSSFPRLNNLTLERMLQQLASLLPEQSFPTLSELTSNYRKRKRLRFF